MEQPNLEHEVKVIKVQVDKLDQMLEGIQDHYLKNLTKLYKDLSQSLELVGKIRDRIDAEIKFLEELDDTDKSKIDLATYFSDD